MVMARNGDKDILLSCYELGCLESTILSSIYKPFRQNLAHCILKFSRFNKFRLLFVDIANTLLSEQRKICVSCLIVCLSFLTSAITVLLFPMCL